VISLAGERRVGESVLTALGLAHWSCKSPEDYFKTAVELALQPQEIQKWRSQLRQKVVTSVVCDGPAYARELESAYRQIWRDYCASERATAL
jgi:predicted O-linked N-acetylglucosamine transferase (SPINDLY family)